MIRLYSPPLFTAIANNTYIVEASGVSCIPGAYTYRLRISLEKNGTHTILFQYRENNKSDWANLPDNVDRIYNEQRHLDGVRRTLLRKWDAFNKIFRVV